MSTLSTINFTVYGVDDYIFQIINFQFWFQLFKREVDFIICIILTFSLFEADNNLKGNISRPRQWTEFKYYKTVLQKYP